MLCKVLLSWPAKPCNTLFSLWQLQCSYIISIPHYLILYWLPLPLMTAKVVHLALEVFLAISQNHHFARLIPVLF